MDFISSIAICLESRGTQETVLKSKWCVVIFLELIVAFFFTLLARINTLAFFEFCFLPLISGCKKQI
jgi:hypothetical protein